MVQPEALAATGVLNYQIDKKEDRYNGNRLGRNTWS